MDLREYGRAFDEAQRDFEMAVEEYGLEFERCETSFRDARMRASSCSCHCENGGSSLWRNWISPACVACRTGEATATFFVDLRCTKKCYFCFNPNQDHYEYFLSHMRDIVAELERAHAMGERFSCLAITGGEPMLHPEQVNDFLRRASQLYPDAHTRLYTCADALDEHGLQELAKSGLREIRFSVKPFDAQDDQRRVLECIERAVELIADVMLEIPVIPGSLTWMKELMSCADAIGVRGMNLLEFCFPLHNAQEFAKRGFRLRKRPFKYLYNYWYGGGVPVAGSEDEALELLAFAEREGFRMGIHYCSSDNKNTGQIYQQNKVFFTDLALRGAYPWLQADEGDRFLKCAKVFGGDALRAKVWADRGSVAYGYDPDVPSLALSHADAAALLEIYPSMCVAESVNVVEELERDAGLARSALDEPKGFYIREVAIDSYM